jgi:chromosome segregation ATPase
VRRL